MSRVAQAASSTPTPHEAWLLRTKLPNGVLTTCRTQQVGENSFRIDEGVLAILTQFLLDYVNRKNEVRRKKEECETHDSLSPEESALFDFSPILRRGVSISPDPGKFAGSGLPTIIWLRIFNIATGFGSNNSLTTLQQVAAIAASQSRPRLLQRANPSLFPVIPTHPNQFIEAVLHGDEKMVRDILNAVPELVLKEGTAIDLLGHKFTGTPLQAAIAVDDVAPNTNSTGTVEIILEHLKRFDPDNYHALLEKQARSLYEKSLRVYVQKQEKEIARLCKLGGELPASDPQQTKIDEKIKQATKNVRAYLTALRSQDLNTIFKTHQKAQADNAFDFKPYVDAILDIDLNDPKQKAELDDVMALINAKTTEETKAAIERTGVAPKQADDCRNTPFHSLTLVQKLNRFREAFVLHAQQEIIFNPHHILAGLQSNEKTWDTLSHAADPSYHKRSVIFSQLVGWVQRNASEPTRQNIRFGTWYLTEKNEPLVRQSGFNGFNGFNGFDSNYNIVRNSLLDVSLADSSSIDGVGYKFTFVGGGWWSVAGGTWRSASSTFSKLMSSKNNRLGENLCGLRQQRSRGARA